MKLSNVFAKLTFVKSNVVRVAAAVALTGAVFTLAAPAAEAERHVVVRFVGPRYYEPAPPVRFYGGPVYFGDRYERDWRFRHDFEREREFRYDRERDLRRDYDRDRRYDRDDRR